jgi:Uncharacterized ACR, COG1993
MCTKVTATTINSYGNGCCSRQVSSASAAAAFKAMAGFGRHHVLHEAHFFELAGSLAVEIEFIVTDEEAQRLLALIHTEKIRLFYAHIPARFGVINPDSADPPMVVAP